MMPEHSARGQQTLNNQELVRLSPPDSHDESGGLSLRLTNYYVENRKDPASFRTKSILTIIAPMASAEAEKQTPLSDREPDFLALADIFFHRPQTIDVDQMVNCILSALTFLDEDIELLPQNKDLIDLAKALTDIEKFTAFINYLSATLFSCMPNLEPIPIRLGSIFDPSLDPLYEKLSTSEGTEMMQFAFRVLLFPPSDSFVSEEVLLEENIQQLLFDTKSEKALYLTPDEKLQIAERVFREEEDTDFGKTIRKKEPFINFCQNLLLNNRDEDPQVEVGELNLLHFLFSSGDHSPEQLLNQLSPEGWIDINDTLGVVCPLFLFANPEQAQVMSERKGSEIAELVFGAPMDSKFGRMIRLEGERVQFEQFIANIRCIFDK